MSTQNYADVFSLVLIFKLLYKIIHSNTKNKQTNIHCKILHAQKDYILFWIVLNKQNIKIYHTFIFYIYPMHAEVMYTYYIWLISILISLFCNNFVFGSTHSFFATVIND